MNGNTCPYCGEDAGRTELGFDRGIHPHHQAGTPYWVKWYGAMREQGLRQTEIGDLLYAAYERRAVAAQLTLSKLHAWQKKKKEE